MCVKKVKKSDLMSAVKRSRHPSRMLLNPFTTMFYRFFHDLNVREKRAVVY
jgi:hypothetical protein